MKPRSVGFKLRVLRFADEINEETGLPNGIGKASKEFDIDDRMIRRWKKLRINSRRCSVPSNRTCKLCFKSLFTNCDDSRWIDKQTSAVGHIGEQVVQEQNAIPLGTMDDRPIQAHFYKWRKSAPCNAC